MIINKTIFKIFDFKLRKAKLQLYEQLTSAKKRKKMKKT